MSSRTLVYLAITTLSAACGLVIEIAAGRMVAPYIGMSLYTWTAIIAVVLAGFSLGHWVGGRMSAAVPDMIRRNVAISLLLAGASTALSLLLIRLLSGPIIGLGWSPVPTILVLTSVLFFLPSLFVGIPAPALTKLAIDEAPERMGPTLGTFYAAGAAGSIAGTLAAGYVFISWLGTITTILMVSVAYFVMAMALALTSRENTRTTLLTITGIALVATSLISLGGHRLNAFASPCDNESNYYCIRVIDETADVGTPARALILDNLGHGINLKDKPQTLVTPYIEMQDILARIHTGQRSPFRAFFIGGGAYTLPRAWLSARTDAEIVVAEIDPAVTAVARSSLWFTPDARLNIRHEDARNALRAQPRGTFDVIVGDAFHDITMPQHLATREFFALVRSRLASDGIYVMNVVDNRDNPRLAASILATVATSFPVSEIWRSTEQGRRATFVVAGLAKATPYATIPSRTATGMSFERIAPHKLSAMIHGQAIVLTDDYAPVDRLIGVW